jgi:hypothetical protein
VSATFAGARVRWGNQRFWRINEFATLEAALAFAEELRATQAERPINITVERRDGERWVGVGTE